MLATPMPSYQNCGKHSQFASQTNSSIQGAELPWRQQQPIAALAPTRARTQPWCAALSIAQPEGRNTVKGLCQQQRAVPTPAPESHHIRSAGYALYCRLRHPPSPYFLGCGRTCASTATAHVHHPGPGAAASHPEPLPAPHTNIHISSPSANCRGQPQGPPAKTGAGGTATNHLPHAAATAAVRRASATP